MLPLSPSRSQQMLGECNLEGWSFEDRIEAMAYASNTLSGIFALLEADEEPKTGYGISLDVGLNCFGYESKEDWGDEFGYTGAIAFQAKMFPRFSLLSREETVKEGPYGSRLVTVHSKTPRGFVFGDPVAARCLSACYDVGISPIGILTSAAKKGATRPTTTSVTMLSLLGVIGEATEKDILTYCFWRPNSRKEHDALRVRVNKNLYRLDENGLIDLEKIPHLYRYDARTGREPEDVPPLTGSDGWKKRKATAAVARFLYEHTGQSFTASMVTGGTDVGLPDTVQILKYLSGTGFCMYEGETGKKTRISLTEFGRRISDQVTDPIMRAAKEGFGWQDFEPMGSREEYQRFWGSCPPVDRGYVTGEFREALGRLSDPGLYMHRCEGLMKIDREQNPWRK